MFTEESLWFKTVAQDLTAAFRFMYINFIRNKWFCRKKEFQERDMCKSPVKLSRIPELFDYIQSNSSSNMALVFCFLPQCNSPKQDHGCWKGRKIDMGCFMQQSSWDLGVIPDDQFSLCVPTGNISEFLEQLVAPMSSTMRPRETCHKYKAVQQVQGFVYCCCYWLVVHLVLTLPSFIFFPLQSSHKYWLSDCTGLCLALELCGEKPPLCHILALPISVLSMLYLSVPLCREMWSINDKWCFRKNSVPQNMPDGVYSVWS